jgi:tetratricopeptide (TPR) repeat protein
MLPEQPVRFLLRPSFKLSSSMRSLVLLVFISSAVFGQSVEKAKKLWEEKKPGEAKKLLTPIAEGQPDYAAARYYLGRISFDEKNYDGAEEYFEEAIEANDKVADYHYWYGSTIGTIAQGSNTLKQGMLAPKIKSEFEKTVELDPKNMSAHWGLIEFYTQAPGFMGGSWEKAEETAKAILKIKKAEGYRALAVVYERQEKWAEAETQYKQAAFEDPTYVFSLANFYTKQKKYDKVFPIFEDALKKNKDDMLAAYQLGKVSAISGQKLDQGETCLLRYLSYQPKQNEPSHAGANMRLGQIKEKNGSKPEAKKYYEKAIQLDANLKEAKEGLARVK